MKSTRIFLIVVFIFLTFTVSASEVKEYELKNGLKIIVLEEHKSPVATFQIWYRAGSKDEPAGKSGLSHLLEHMMFKGTSKYGPSEFSKIVQRNGGTDNAYTTKDYTAYFTLLSSDRIMISIDLESDRMSNLILDPKEMLSEKNVVMEERRLNYEDDPENSLYEDVVAAAYKVHPYQRPVIGWMSDLEHIERDDLYEFYKTYYSPDNAFILIVGDVDADKMVEKVRQSFENIHTGPSKERIKSVEPEQRGERRVYLKKEAKLPYILIAYHTPSFPHDDSYALEVLSFILSDGKSSRLYKSLVYEQKVSLSVSAYYSTFNKEPYLFFFSSKASPGKDIKDVETSIYREIDRIKEEPPSAYEVQKAKNQIEASFIMDQDSIFMQAMNYGIFEMLGDWRLIEKYLDGIRKVTPDDVLRAANKYFKEDNRTVGILMPIKSQS
jgi:zinc protease